MQEFLEFALRHWMLFVALLVILGLLIGSEVWRKLRGVKDVTPNEALQLINDQEALVVDLRDNGEFKAGHIPNARNIPLGSLESRLNELERFKEKPVIVYCRAGVSSSSACGLLKKNGFKWVNSLSGGLSAWQGASLPTSKK